MPDVMDARDAIQMAETTVNDLLAEIMAEWQRPDEMLKLAIGAATLPDEDWDYVSDETIQGIGEVFGV